MLLLTTPAQHISQNPAVECDPRRIRHWLGELSCADAQTTVNQLINALKPFNELQLDVRERLKLLEIYYAEFENILSGFDEIHLRTLQLDLSQRRSLSDDIMWAYLELANGYKSIAKAVYEGQDASISREDIQLSIYRGIELIANALIYAFRDHQTPPPLVYLEVHQLYFLAEQYELAAEPIATLKRQVRKPTIEHLYKRIMLLIAGNAYGYDGSQVNELYELLDEYTQECRLLKTLAESDMQRSYFIDFTEDEGPRSLRRQDTDKLLAMQRIIDMSDALARIQADLAAGSREPAGSIRASELRLLRLFLQNLRQGNIPPPSSVRSRGELARVAYGAESVIYYLQHRERFLETPEESVEGIEVRDIDLFEAEHSLLEWEVVAVNAGGRVLLATQQDDVYLRVGELVSIVENIGASRNTLIHHGLIRWLRYVQDKVQVGIEFIAGTPLPVQCQALDNRDSETPAFDAVYFPSNKETRQPATLLFDYDQYRSATRFIVTVSGQRYCIEAVKTLRESPGYIQFGFRVVKPDG